MAEACPTYILLFRELSSSPEWTLDLQMFRGKNQRVSVLAGKGETTVLGNRLTVHIQEKLQYLWLRVE